MVNANRSPTASTQGHPLCAPLESPRSPSRPTSASSIGHATPQRLTENAHQSAIRAYHTRRQDRSGTKHVISALHMCLTISNNARPLLIETQKALPDDHSHHRALTDVSSNMTPSSPPCRKRGHDHMLTDRSSSASGFAVLWAYGPEN